MRENNFLFSLYTRFNSTPFVFIRLFILFAFPAFIILTWALPFAVIFVTLYCFFLMNEAFISFKVNRTRPYHKLSDAKTELVYTMKFPFRALFEKSDSLLQLITFLSHLPECIFVTDKIGPGFSFAQVDLEKDDVLQQAGELVRAVKGDYITSVDYFVAYLFLSEETTHYFQTNDLGKEDVIGILYWVRNVFSVDSVPSVQLHFGGQSFGDFLVYGWDVEVRKYTVDLTAKVISYAKPPTLVGRKMEYDQFLNILSKERNNNVILVGEEGTGKTLLVEHYAYESHLREAPKALSGKRVFELLADRLIAGAKDQGDLQERIGYFLSDVQHTGNAIIYIQNIENIFGGGGFHFDISGVITEYLQDTKIPFIGTTTPSAYRTFLERRSGIVELFEVMRIEEPEETMALFMLFDKVGQIEGTHHVSFTYNAIKEAVSLSSSYLLETYLPGKALDLLDEVAAEVMLSKKNVVDKEDVIKKIEQRTHVVIGTPTAAEREKLLRLEDEIHKRIIDQEEAVHVISEALRRLRSGFSSGKRPISVFLFLGPTGVGKTETAKALAAIYFGSEQVMIRLDMSEYQTQESIKRLLGSLPGEEEVASEFLEAVRHHPFSVILLDEFEKAHPRILDVFLQVFDDGRLTDNRGKTASFRNTIIIATSNAGSEFIREKLVAGSDITGIKQELLDLLQKQQLYRPELLNRFDEIIIFKPLGENEVAQVAKLTLTGILKALEEKQIYITFDESLIQKIAKEAFNKEFGARPVRRYIQEHVEGLLSQLILQDQLKKGAHKKLTVDVNGDITLV